VLQILRNADVYAPDALGIQDLIVGGGKILWMGAAAPKIADLEVGMTSAKGAVATELDLEGRRVIPGLIDGHVHFTGGGGEAGFATRVPPLALNQFLDNGITSAIGVLGFDDCTRTTAELLATTRGFAEHGFGAWCMTGGYHLPLTTLTGSVREDLVHLDRVIGVGEFALSDHRSSQPTLQELLRLASEAHFGALATNKACLLHLHMGDGPRGLDLVRAALAESELPAAMFQPTHINRKRALFEEAIDLAGEGCPIEVTAFPVAEDEDAWAAEDAVELFLETELPRSCFTISSDGGGCLPEFDEHGRMTRMDVGQPHAITDCLQNLLRRGHDLNTVLPFFTSNVANTWRLPGKGQIAVGADADLVLLDASGRPERVMLGGRFTQTPGAGTTAPEPHTQPN
jgi:beta-aspartyl-dipeptidase (metallo-type)